MSERDHRNFPILIAALVVLIASLATLCSNNRLWAQTAEVPAYPEVGSFQTILEPSRKYEGVNSFYNGFSQFSKNNKQGLCDVYGNEVIAPIYDSLYYYNDADLFQVSDAGTYGVINLQGETVIPTVYDGVLFHDGENLFQVREGDTISFLDIDGSFIAEIPNSLMVLGFFHEGLISAIDLESGGYTYLDREARIVSGERRFERAGEFMDGVAFVGLDGEFGLIDRDWNFTSFSLPLSTGVITSGNSSDLWLNPDGLWGCVDRKGNILVPNQYDAVFFTYVSEDGNRVYTSVRNQEGKIGIIDRTGTVLIPFDFDVIELYGVNETGVLLVRQDEQWGILSEAGEWVLEPSYDAIELFREGLTLGRRGEEWFLLDTSGNLVTSQSVSSPINGIYPPGYFRGGLCAVAVNGKFGYIGRDGIPVIPFEYDQVTNFSDGFAWVRKDGLWGILRALAPGEEPLVVEPPVEAIITEPLTVNLPSQWGETRVRQAIDLELAPESLRMNYLSPITRAQFSSLLVRVIEDFQGGVIDINDAAAEVDENLAKLLQLGLISGVAKNDLAAEMLLNREQAAAFLSRLMEHLGRALPDQDLPLEDAVLISPWASLAVRQTLSAGLLFINDDNRFRPQETVNIEEAIVAVMNAYIHFLTCELPSPEDELLQIADAVRQAQPVLSEENERVFAIINGEAVPMRTFERQLLGLKLDQYQQRNYNLRNLLAGYSTLSYRSQQDFYRERGLGSEEGLHSYAAQHLIDNAVQRQLAEAFGQSPDLETARQNIVEMEKREKEHAEIQQRFNIPQLNRLGAYEAWATGYGLDYAAYREKYLVPENAEILLASAYKHHFYEQFIKENPHLNGTEQSQAYPLAWQEHLQKLLEEAEITYVDGTP